MSNNNSTKEIDDDILNLTQTAAAPPVQSRKTNVKQGSWRLSLDPTVSAIKTLSHSISQQFMGSSSTQSAPALNNTAATNDQVQPVKTTKDDTPSPRGSRPLMDPRRSSKAQIQLESNIADRLSKLMDVIPRLEDDPQNTLISRFDPSSRYQLAEIAEVKTNSELSLKSKEDIDLQCLKELCLYPKDVVNEPDVVWVWDTIFSKIASEMQQDSELPANSIAANKESKVSMKLA